MEEIIIFLMNDRKNRLTAAVVNVISVIEQGSLKMWGFKKGFEPVT